MAGPWFTVYKSGDDWTHMGDVWVSNGQFDCRAKFYVRATLAELNEEQHALLMMD